MKNLTKVIDRKSFFLIFDLKIFFKSLNGQTSDILKHISRFPSPKITPKSQLQEPVLGTMDRRSKPPEMTGW